MKKDAAEFIAWTTLKATSRMANLIPFAKDLSESEEEYEKFRAAFTKIARIASQQVMGPIFAAHPEIEARIDAFIEEFGQLP